MKKLLIAMTAAAVGTCAWADGDAGGDGQGTTPATPAMLSESFSTTWTPAAPWWSYTGDATAELAATNVPTKTDANNIALYLNTGSKVLSGNFGGIGADDKPVAVNIPNNNLYFKSTVIFNDPSDTLPELGQNDKFALVVLDNIDSVQDTEYDQATNLWVIAGHGVDGKRAYLLCPNVNTLELDAGWLSAPHEITVKAYNNVLTGSSAAGFLVMIGTDICTVKKSYKIVNGLIDYSTGTDVDYLGYTSAQVALSERYANKQLLISAASGATLTSVDFQGQGIIDDVSLATTGADFGPDVTAKTVTFTGFNSDGIASINPSLNNGVYTIRSGTANGNIEFTVTLNTDYELNVTAGDKVTVSGSAPTYTVTYAYDGGESYSIALDVFKPAAYVNGEAVKAEDFANLFQSNFSSDTTIKLNGGLTLDGNAIQVDSGVTLAIDLNGNTITPAEDYPAVVNGGTLVITDSDIQKRGTVAGALIGAGVFDLQAGRYLASAYPFTDGEENVWKFEELKLANNGFKATGPTDGYYVITAAPTTFAVTYEAGNFTLTKLNGETYEAFTSGTELANDTYTFKVAAAEGYKVDSVTVGGVAASVAADGTFSVTVSGDDVAIVVTATLKTFAVTSTVATGATVTGLKESYNWGETLTFTVDVAADYENLEVKINDVVATPDGDGNYTLSEVKADVTVDVSVTKKASDPIPALPADPTNDDVATALTGQADSAVAANVTTPAEYNAFKAWAGDDAAAVKASANAWVAYALDSKDLLAGDKVTLADSDITVESFGQAENAAAGQFTLEISLKGVTIGNATKANLLKIFEAVGTTDLKADFTAGAVTTDVMAVGGKAKFTVAPSAATKPNAFFFKAQIKK